MYVFFFTISVNRVYTVVYGEYVMLPLEIRFFRMISILFGIQIEYTYDNLITNPPLTVTDRRKLLQNKLLHQNIVTILTHL